MTGPGLNNRVKAFCKLGEIMTDACRDKPSGKHSAYLRSLAVNQSGINTWFTEANVLKSIYSIATWLNKSSLISWLEEYNIPDLNNKPKKVGVIMAGNIPLVAFHDFLCVVLSGNILIGKTSSKDSVLIKELTSILLNIEPLFKDLIRFTDEKLTGCDAIIATGSDNSSRYFDYYYGSKEHIFRKNRNSVAVIDSETSDSDLTDLGSDVFDYFGLGCRNVSKLYLPADFNINRLERFWAGHKSLMEHKSYSNNYIYNRGLLKLNKSNFHDMGFAILVGSDGFSSPVSTIYYGYYNKIEEVKSELLFNKDKIQTIVGKGYTPYGKAQSPDLNDYADGVDTMDFLLKLK